MFSADRPRASGRSSTAAQRKQKRNEGVVARPERLVFLFFFGEGGLVKEFAVVLCGELTPVVLFTVSEGEPARLFLNGSS